MSHHVLLRAGAQATVRILGIFDDVPTAKAFADPEEGEVQWADVYDGATRLERHFRVSDDAGGWEAWKQI